MTDKVTLAKIVQIMVLDNCMSDDGAFWNAYMKLSDQAQREALEEHVTHSRGYGEHEVGFAFQFGVLDAEAGLLTPDQAEVVAGGDENLAREIVEDVGCRYLDHFLEAVFNLHTPGPEVLAKLGGEADV